MDWLRDNYSSYRFYTERDVVWTVQERLRRDIEARGLPLRLFNDYGVVPGKRRSLAVDLAVVDEEGTVLLAVEFKYEPSHRRTDIPKTKFPVVFWGGDGVGKDVDRITQLVADGRVERAIALFIDEGGFFAGRAPHEGSQWLAWDEHPEYGQTSILWAEADVGGSHTSADERGAQPRSRSQAGPRAEEWDSVVEALDTRLPGWRDQVLHHDQVSAAEDRAEGRLWADDEIFGGLILSLLSSNTNWDRVRLIRNQLPTVFNGFSIGHFAGLADDKIEAINDWFKARRAGSMTLKARLFDLRSAAESLIQRSEKHGSIEQYFRDAMGDHHPKVLVQALAKSGGEQKLAGFGIPLAAEALRNIGYDLAKPDRHVNRFVGARGWMQFRNWAREGPHDAPSASDAELVRVMEYMEEFADSCGERVSFVDSAVWLLCAQSGAHLRNEELASLAPRRPWED